MQVKSQDDMNELRSWFEVPTIAHYFQTFRRAFHLTEFDIEDLEEALFVDSSGTVNDESNADFSTLPSPSFLPELVILLLNGLCKRKSGVNITLENYNQCLYELLSSHYGSSKDNPLQNSTFQEVTARKKVEILYDLINWRIFLDDASILTRYLDAAEMRVDPVGKDSEGNVFWYFYGCHLYKEASSSKKGKVNKKAVEHKPILKDKNTIIIIDSDDDEEVIIIKDTVPNIGNSAGTDCKQSSDTNETNWSLICSSVDEWEHLLKTLKVSKSVNVKQLRTNLQDIYEDIPAIIRRRDNKLLKRQLATAPRRISNRISAKVQQTEAEEKVREQERLLEEEQHYLRMVREAEEEEKLRNQLEAERAEELEKLYLFRRQQRAFRSVARGNIFIDLESQS